MKKHSKIQALVLSAAILASVYVQPVKASVESVQLLQNGSFEITDEYDFPLNWESNGENLIPNGDFESRHYWNYNNGYLSYEYDETLNSTVAKLAWNALNKWNAVTMRTDKYGIYWDYEQNKRMTETTLFPGVPIAWGESYIPRMKMKYTGDLDEKRYLEMEMKIGSALATVSEGATYDVINVVANTFPKDTWQELGGGTFTIPEASSVVSTYDDSTPGIINLINVGRSQTKTSGDYTTAFTWTDDAKLEKIGRASSEAAYSGGKSLMIRGYADGITEEWKSDYVDVYANETLSVESWVKIDEISQYVRGSDTILPEVSVKVEFDDNSVSEISSLDTQTDGFTLVSGNVVVPEGASRARLVYSFAGKGTAYFDGAGISAERETADIDLGAYVNKVPNSGFESVDDKSFPVSWDSNGKNLIPNGDFESNSLSSGNNLTGTKPVGYVKVGNVSEIAVVENDDMAPEELGNYSLKMTWGTSTNWGGSVVQDDTNGVVKLAYDSDYILRATVKAGADDQFLNQDHRFQFNVITSYLKNGAKNQDSIVDDTSWVPTTKWTEYSKTFSTPSKTEVEEAVDPFAMRYQVRARAAGKAGAELFVDNFSMEKVGRVDSDTSNTGSNSLKIVAYDDGINEEWVSDKISVRANEEVAIGASYKTLDLDGGVSVVANFYNGDELIKSITLIDGAKSEQWKTAAKTTVVPDNATTAQMTIVLPGKSGCAWVDDVFLGEKAGSAYINSIDYSLDDIYGYGGEEVEIDVNVSNYNEAAEIFIASVLYDAEDNLIAIDAKEEEVAANTSSQTFKRYITLPEDVDLTYYKIKTMLWQNAQTLVPLCKAEVFPEQVSQFTVNKVFQDNMVLQRDQKIAVYGQGTPGEPIKVSLGADMTTVTVDPYGDWIAYLPQRSASTAPVAMAVAGRGGREFIFENILIGDVFIMSGQSNAAFSISEVNDFRQNPDEANDNIRVLGMYEASNDDALGSQEEKKDLPTAEELNVKGASGVTDPTWLSFDPKQTESEIRTDPLTRDTSAVLYYFAKEVQSTLEDETGEVIPVGLITAAVGGTRIEKWLPKEVYEEHPDLTADQEHLKSTLYNNMINPLTNFKIKGILWYQGCANAASSVRYERELEYLIESWREIWKS